MLTVTVNSETVAEVLSKIAWRLDNLWPVMASIGQELESRVSARFEAETDPMGQPWAPWAQSTLVTYPSAGNRRLLDRYGDMLLSLNYQANGDSVRVGFGAPYAAFDEWVPRPCLAAAF